MSPEEGQELAKELGENVGWIETSAKSDTGVNKVFEEILKRVNVQKQSILKETQDENSGCCCICWSIIVEHFSLFLNKLKSSDFKTEHITQEALKTSSIRGKKGLSKVDVCT